jgi:nucleoside-diphosphate-sugar epimerase
MTTLVTGAFGCIGAWVVRGLLASGQRPVVFDLGDDPWRVRMIAGPDAPSRMTVVRGDITDRESLGRVVRHHGIRRVIHLAAWQVPLCRQDPPRGAAINVVGTANVFEVARAAAGQVERVVYASSAAVFGARLLGGHRIPSSGFRPLTVYGPGRDFGHRRPDPGDEGGGPRPPVPDPRGAGRPTSSIPRTSPARCSTS